MGTGSGDGRPKDAWQLAADDGEDMEQLAWLLTLTPTQRLLLEGARRAVRAFRQAGRRLYGFDPSNPPAAE